MSIHFHAYKTRRIAQRGTRAAQPAAADASGVIYHVTDESVVERSDGTRWEPVTGAVTVGVHNLLDGYAHSDTAEKVAVRGALIYGNSTPAWDRLAVGAANRVLRSDGTDIAWGQVALTTDVSGDLPLANLAPSSAASRLLGRGSASAGDWQEITLGAGITLSGTEISVTASGAGDVLGPASSTDNAVVRFNGATGKAVQNSGVIVDDSNNVTGVVALTTTGQVGGPNGSATAPAFAASGDTNTGVYFDGSDGCLIATGGTLRVTVNTASVTATLPFLGPTGSAGAPPYSASSDPNTGMYFDGSDAVLFATGGTKRVSITSAGDLTVETTKKLFLDGGGDTYHIESSANVLDTYVGGVINIRQTSTYCGLNLPLTFVNPLAASFSGTQNDYSPSGWATANIIHLTGSSTPVITGFAATNSGDIRVLINVAATTISLSHESGSSAAANRIVNRSLASISLTQYEAMWIVYSGTLSRWVAFVPTA